MLLPLLSAPNNINAAVASIAKTPSTASASSSIAPSLCGPRAGLGNVLEAEERAYSYAAAVDMGPKAGEVAADVAKL